jgi:hypothetical protein
MDPIVLAMFSNCSSNASILNEGIISMILLLIVSANAMIPVPDFAIFDKLHFQ